MALHNGVVTCAQTSSSAMTSAWSRRQPDFHSGERTLQSPIVASSTNSGSRVAKRSIMVIYLWKSKWLIIERLRTKNKMGESFEAFAEGGKHTLADFQIQNAAK
ncbi:hypothetical protein AC1031_001563 [Aphanomyces cochlioides]|nr:hypothetical protein AC1031_001563 [Aphanomyces cochlioides]